MNTNRYLIVCRAGDHSRHKEWLEPASYKNFDLFIDYYGDHHNRYVNECQFYSESKGTKYQAIFNLIQRNRELIFKYDAVWFPDDDISTDCFNINQMFEFFSRHQLLLAQPGLTADSFYSHYITIQNPHYSLRYTSYVEGMVPIFSRKALEICMDSFRKSQSGWGIDMAWIKLLGYSRDKVGIIDGAPVKHTRPVGGGEIYKSLQIDPWGELYRIASEYQFPVDFNFIVYGGIPK